MYVPTSIPICLSASLPTKAQYKFVSWFKIHLMQEIFLHNLSRDTHGKHLYICKCVVHIDEDEDLKFKNSFMVIFNAVDLLCFFSRYLFSYKRQFRFDVEWVKRLISRYNMNMNMYICICMYSFDCYMVGCPWWRCKCSAMESFRVFVCHRRSWQKDQTVGSYKW